MKPLVRVFVPVPTAERPERTIAIQSLVNEHVPVLQIELTSEGPGRLWLDGGTRPPEFFSTSELAFGILGIVRVPGAGGHCLVIIKDCELVGRLCGEPVLRITRTVFIPFEDVWDDDAVDRQSAVRAACSPVAKFLEAGDFYFSPGYNLTRSLQSQADTGTGVLQQSTAGAAAAASFSRPDPQSFRTWVRSFDRSFWWNRFMLAYFLKHRLRAFALTPVIKGSVVVARCSVATAADRLELAVLSRIGCRHAGTRFNARGINDDGAVANFVETEQIALIQGQLTSFVQSRGSVPVFWEQKFVKTSYQVTLTRSSEATAPAFAKHLNTEVDRCGGGQVQLINLLSAKDKERALSEAYRRQVELFNAAARGGANVGPVDYHEFDVHARCPAMKFDELAPFLKQVFDEKAQRQMGFFWRKTDDEAAARLGSQNSVFRVNCLDCLDRTNFFQTAIAWRALTLVLERLGFDASQLSSELRPCFIKLWESNGMCLSKEYAGASSSKANYSRKDGKRAFLRGLVDDAKNHAQRFVANTFLDGSRQQAIDIIIGKEDDDLEDEIGDEVTERLLAQRVDEFSQVSQLSVFIGSWNVNGQAPGEDVAQWLYPALLQDDESSSAGRERRRSPPDVYCVGFQEIVALTTENVLVKTDESNANLWIEQIQKLLASVDDYVLLKSKQLVGVLSMVFVRKPLMAHVRSIHCALVKLGYGGMTANKGAVGIRFQVHDTRICFVCAHLAAGQSHIEDRNKDWRDVMEGMEFATTLKRHRRIDSHDVVFFFGDFNYRVALSRSEVMDILMSGGGATPAVRAPAAAALEGGFDGDDSDSDDDAGSSYEVIGGGASSLPRPKDAASGKASRSVSSLSSKSKSRKASSASNPPTSRAPVSIESATPTALKALLNHDQLRTEQKAGRTFVQFSEAPIQFLPTYKYDVGSAVYDSSEKQRIPAWTDRILHRSSKAAKLQQLHYTRAELLSSDHRPVYAIYKLSVRIVDVNRRLALFDRLQTSVRSPASQSPALAVGRNRQSTTKGADCPGGDEAATSDPRRSPRVNADSVAAIALGSQRVAEGAMQLADDLTLAEGADAAAIAAAAAANPGSAMIDLPGDSKSVAAPTQSLIDLDSFDTNDSGAAPPPSAVEQLQQSIGDFDLNSTSSDRNALLGQVDSLSGGTSSSSSLMASLAESDSSPTLHSSAGLAMNEDELVASLRNDTSSARSSSLVSPPVMGNSSTWVIGRDNYAKYCTFFSRLAEAIEVGGRAVQYAPSAGARVLFLRSGLPESELRVVWSLCSGSQPPVPGLREHEFALALWLINARKRGAQLPTLTSNATLPSALIDSARRGGVKLK